MNYFITFQPNKYNASDRELVINFKKGLQRYYKKLLGSRYNKNKGLQYKMDVDLSHGDNDQEHTHPHLHINANIPANHINNFMRFMTNWLRTTYPKLSADCQYLQTDLDKLKSGLYSLNQAVKSYNEQDFQSGNYII
mgnify:CR=1 FL=1